MKTKSFEELKGHVGHKVRVMHYPEEDVRVHSDEHVRLECGCGLTLLMVDRKDDFLNKSERAEDCVQRIINILWPEPEHPQEKEWDAEVMTEVANALGDYGFGPHAKEQGCEHEVDPSSVSWTDGTDSVFDCRCLRCNKEGSFRFDSSCTVTVKWVE